MYIISRSFWIETSFGNLSFENKWWKVIIQKRSKKGLETVFVLEKHTHNLQGRETALFSHVGWGVLVKLAEEGVAPVALEVEVLTLSTYPQGKQATNRQILLPRCLWEWKNIWTDVGYPVPFISFHWAQCVSIKVWAIWDVASGQHFLIPSLSYNAIWSWAFCVTITFQFTHCWLDTQGLAYFA